MPRIHVTNRNGAISELTVEASGNLMEALRNVGVAGIDGMCGGCCSCATCHVHIDPEMAERLAPPSDDEAMLMTGLMSYSSQSRLSCQIEVTDAIDGLRVTIPAE